MVNELFTHGCHFPQQTARRVRPAAWGSAMDISGVSAAGGSHAASGAISIQQRMSSLFDSIDTSGSGSITQLQFNQAFQARTPPAGLQQQGAHAIFAKLDPDGTGSVSKQDFVSGMSKLVASLNADNAGASASPPSTSLAPSAQFLTLIDLASLPTIKLPASQIPPPLGSFFDLKT
jgi:hypothetical protein